MFGRGLYLATSARSGYNNLIVIASEKQTLGMNPEADADPVPVLADTYKAGIVTSPDRPEQRLWQEVAQPSEASTLAERDALAWQKQLWVLEVLH